MKRLGSRAGLKRLACLRVGGPPSGRAGRADGMSRAVPPSRQAAPAAEFLRRSGLRLPALILLEVASPFWPLIQQALWVAHPALSPWAGDRLLLWANRLEDGEAFEAARQRLAE